MLYDVTKNWKKTTQIKYKERYLTYLNFDYIYLFLSISKI